MNQFARCPAALGLLSVVALMLGLAAPASASPAPPPPATYSPDTAGYHVLGTKAFNDVRATITFPAGTGTRSQASLLLRGAAGAGPEAELTFAYNGGSSHAWTLKFGYNPAGAAPKLSTVSPLFVARGAPVYLEIHYSTKTHVLTFLAGREQAPVARASIAGVHGTFSAPAAEVTSLAPGAQFLPAHATQALFTRVGVTELLQPANPSSPTKRLTLAAESLGETFATTSGLPPTVNDEVTLAPSSLGAGSQFRVTATGFEEPH